MWPWPVLCKAELESLVALRPSQLWRSHRSIVASYACTSAANPPKHHYRDGGGGGVTYFAQVARRQCLCNICGHNLQSPRKMAREVLTEGIEYRL